MSLAQLCRLSIRTTLHCLANVLIFLAIAIMFGSFRMSTGLDGGDTLTS